MKRFLLFALVATMFVACETDAAEDVAVKLAVPETLTVSFYGDSRIQLQNGESVWNEGDLVSVFYKSYDNLKFKFDGKTGDRSGTLSIVDGEFGTQTMGHTIVAYPYSSDYRISLGTGGLDATLPATQHYTKDSYGVGCNLMVAESVSTYFSLKNVCGLLKVQLRGEGQVVKSITLKGNNNEQVAGLVHINTADATLTLASTPANDGDSNSVAGNLVLDNSTSTTVTLDCGEGVTLGSEATAFYIALPPQTFEKGLTISIETTDGYATTKSISNAITIARNRMPIYDGVVSEVYELAYTTNDGMPLDPYITDGFGANFVENIYDATTGKGALKFDDTITTIPEKAFIACTNLTNIELPLGITAINAEAFSGCRSLLAMNIPQGVESVGDKAFYNCGAVTDITIPDSVTSIGTSSFEGCGGKAVINCKIASSDFYKARFTEIVIGDNITSIGNYAFEHCTSLTSVYYTGNLSAWCKMSFRDAWANPLNNGAKLYLKGVEATDITIPSDITEIKDYTFYGCTSLTSVTIPDSVTSIGNYAFEHCTSLTSIKIPKRVTSIESYTFYGCTSLTSVTMHNRVTSIGSYAFKGCTSLTSVTIPDSVTSIGGYAFGYCRSLKEVYCKPTPPPTGSNNMFYDNASCRKIYVPTASVEAYKLASRWSDYASSIVGYDF